MTTYKYRTKNYDTSITKVEVDKETPTSVWVKGRRESRVSEYQRWHDSWEEAHEYLIRKLKAKIAATKSNLAAYEAQLKKVKEMEELSR